MVTIPSQDLEFRTAGEIELFLNFLISRGELEYRSDPSFGINFASVFRYKNTNFDYVIDLSFEDTSGSRDLHRSTTKLGISIVTQKLLSKLHFFEEKDEIYGEIERRKMPIPKTYNPKSLKYQSIRTWNEWGTYYDPNYQEQKSTELIITNDDQLFEKITSFLRKF